VPLNIVSETSRWFGSDETFDGNFGITLNIERNFVGVWIHICRRVIKKIAVSNQQEVVNSPKTSLLITDR